MDLTKENGNKMIIIVCVCVQCETSKAETGKWHQKRCQLKETKEYEKKNKSKNK